MYWHYELIHAARVASLRRQKIVLASAYGIWIWYCPWCTVYGIGIDWKIQYANMINHFNRIHSR